MELEVTPSRYLHHLLFADDHVVIITKDKKDFNYMCKNKIKRWGLNSNYSKPNKRQITKIIYIMMRI